MLWDCEGRSSDSSSKLLASYSKNDMCILKSTFAQQSTGHDFGQFQSESTLKDRDLMNWLNPQGRSIIIYWSFLIPVKNWFKFCRTLLHIFINRDNLSHISTHTVHSTLVMGPTTCHQRVSISYMHVLHSYGRSHHLLCIMEVVIVAVHVLRLITCSQLLLLRLCNLLLASVRPLFPTYATGIHLRCCLKHLTVCHCVLLFLMVGWISYHLMLVLKLTLVKIHSWYINTILLRVYLVTT